MRISVLGMGRMGEALAVRWAGGGHEVTVWNRSPGKAGRAVDAGATEAGSVEEAVSKADLVVTMLADDGAVRAVVLEPGGLYDHLGPEAWHLDCSTVSPGVAGEMVTACHRYGAMPVMGSPEAVAGGAATYLLGAPDEVAAGVGPAVAALSDKVVRLRSAPEALAAKLTGNYLLLSGLAVLAEAFEIGRAGGLGDDQLTRIFAESPLVAPGLRNRFQEVLSGPSEGWFSMTLGAKDVGLATDLAASAGQRLPVGGTVQGLYRRAGEAGLSDADVAAVGRLYRDGHVD